MCSSDLPCRRTALALARGREPARLTAAAGHPGGVDYGAVVTLLRPALTDPSAELARARAEVVAALAGDAAHEAHRVAIVAFVDAHPDALLRSCAPGHLTSSALVVDADAERVLLLEHRKLRRWFQPGGHADGEANLARSALREAGEEIGRAHV